MDTNRTAKDIACELTVALIATKNAQTPELVADAFATIYNGVKSQFDDSQCAKNPDQRSNKRI